MTMKNDNDEDDGGKVAITMCADHQGRGQHDAYVSQGATPYGATYIKDGDDYDDDDSCFFFLIQFKFPLWCNLYDLGTIMMMMFVVGLLFLLAILASSS